MVQWLKLYLLEYDDLYHIISTIWWPAEARKQGISTHGIDLAPLEYSGLSMKSVNAQSVAVSHKIVSAILNNVEYWKVY